MTPRITWDQLQSAKARLREISTQVTTPQDVQLCWDILTLLDKYEKDSFGAGKQNTNYA